jgi:GNAT superfamily N-acetyltransferase
MAALTRTTSVRVRAPLLGEGGAIAALWRELWDEHEGWGGYAGSRDPRVYAQLASRLDEDARVRAGHPVLGRHIHLVADLGGAPCGQVEGWLDRHGVDPATPFTCEVRSLIVARSARKLGAGAALLRALGQVGCNACTGTSGSGCVLAAEVLAANPANGFYERIGYRPIAWNGRMNTRAAPPSSTGPFRARLGESRDGLAVARLESNLAARRRAAGDRRFDGPRLVDAAIVGSIAAHLGGEGVGSPPDPATLVAVDADRVVRGVASFTVHGLEPPFVPTSRALLGRFALDREAPALPIVASLVALACRLGASRGAPHVELTDLSAPGTDLHDAAKAAGARDWSRVVMRNACPPFPAD